MNRQLCALRSFFVWAEGRGLVDRLPTSRVRGVRTTQLAPQALDARQQRALLRVLERHGDARDRAMVLIMMEAGLRVSEVCRLCVSDVVLGERKGTARIYGSKGDKDRRVPLNADVRAAIRAYLQVRPVSAAPELFLNARKVACHDDTVQQRVRELGRLAGIEDLHPHALRHTCARALIAKGVDLATVQGILGHSSLATTGIYVRASAADLQEAVERLAWSD